MPKFFEPLSQPHAGKPKELEEPLAPKISEANEIKTLLTWEAPSRPFRKKDHSYYTTIAILVVLLALIAFLAQEFLLIGVLLALSFVAYVLAFIPPGEVTYKISSQGITIGDHFYFWHTLDSFWFKGIEQKVLYVQTWLRFPGQLMLVLRDPSTDSTSSLQTGSGQVSEEEVKKVVAKFLPYHEIHQPPLLERWAEGLQKHFPLENTHR